ncbi:MAG: guanylate kinase [Methylococcales bacterium]|nr:guanylate kinase [Methylococcales bacterium]MCK5925718.1 guanylate kinase [Methylococcales bacterium]
MNQGTLYIISAPSGAGKTSLIKKLLTEMDDLMVSVSHTTRVKRSEEQTGKDYFFVTREKFEEMRTQKAFLESAQVFDHYYGTSKQSVLENLAQGLDVILEIDWQGAQQIRKMLPDCQSIFILPPSIEVLKTRLESRGQDSEAIIQRRMEDAVIEISHHHEFDYMIVNNVFEEAVFALKSIILSNRFRHSRQKIRLKKLLDGLC